MSRATLPRVAFTCRLVGMSFTDAYPAVAVKMERALLLSDGAGELRCVLDRDPDNEHDPNAIKVFWLNEHIGHLPAWLAERLAPELDAGAEWRCRISVVQTHRQNPMNPGIELELRRAE